MSPESVLLVLIGDLWAEATASGIAASRNIPTDDNGWFVLQVLPGGEKPTVRYIDSTGVPLDV